VESRRRSGPSVAVFSWVLSRNEWSSGHVTLSLEHLVETSPTHLGIPHAFLRHIVWCTHWIPRNIQPQVPSTAQKVCTLLLFVYIKLTQLPYALDLNRLAAQHPCQHPQKWVDIWPRQSRGSCFTLLKKFSLSRSRLALIPSAVSAPTPMKI
jgi:hypothetical protein